ncbi:MAG: DUF4126 domain-containing protein, partial [Thermodesulfovibrionales bacterium]
DKIGSPVSVIAGVIASASVITDIPPALKWIVAIMAGGGIAGIFQGATTALRAKSSLFTGGIGNAFVATSELILSTIVASVSIILPIVGFMLVLSITVFIFVKVGKSIFRKKRRFQAKSDSHSTDKDSYTQ